MQQRGYGFKTEEEPSVSIQTPPCMAHFKCSRISSATTITGPQGKQMEARRGGGRRGEGILTTERSNFVKNNH